MATEKQKNVVKKLLENRGMPIGKAMEEVGYKENTAKNPQNLTNSNGWADLMDKYLPNDLLAKQHKKLLIVPLKLKTYIKGELTSEYESLDSQAVSKGLDMAYKLKGHYSPEKKEIGINGVDIFEFINWKNANKDNTSNSKNSETN